MSRYFLHKDKLGIIRLYEEDGSFREHGDVDLLIVTIHDESYGNLLVSLLNERLI